MKHLKNILLKFASRYEVRKQKKHLTELQRRSCDELQVIEFDGDLFLSYHNIPLVSESMLKNNITNTLNSSRTIWVKYQLQKTNNFR